jgi:hypothetical protein
MRPVMWLLTDVEAAAFITLVAALVALAVVY